MQLLHVLDKSQVLYLTFVFIPCNLWVRSMFSKHRLKKEKDIQLVLRKGRGVFDSACGVKYKPSGEEVTRFTVVIGLKVHKSAVKRNRVRRQYREIVRLHLNKIKPGMDMVLLCGKAALELDYKQKEERLLRVLKKAKLLV